MNIYYFLRDKANRKSFHRHEIFQRLDGAMELR